MGITVTQQPRRGRLHRFFPANGDRGTAFISIPKSLVDEPALQDGNGKKLDLPWSRVTAFGEIAEKLNDLLNEGGKILAKRIKTADLRDASFMNSMEEYIEQVEPIIRDYDFGSKTKKAAKVAAEAV